MKSLKYLFQFIIIISFIFFDTLEASAIEMKKGEVPKFESDKANATVYVYRDSHFGCATWEIFINGTYAGLSGCDTVIKLVEEPGQHDLWADYSDKKVFGRHLKELNLVQGKNYYIGIDITGGENWFFVKDDEASKNLILEILE